MKDQRRSAQNPIQAYQDNAYLIAVSAATNREFENGDCDF